MAKALQKGAKGKPVEDLQKALNAARIKPPLKEDGIFGKLTEAALKKYQKKAKLEDGGIADAATLHALKIGPKPKTEDKVPEDVLSLFEDNIKSLTPMVGGTKEASAKMLQVAKFCQAASKTLLVRQKAILATLNALRPLQAEAQTLRKEYDKVKTTQLSRAAAILHRLGEIKKARSKIVADYNKGSNAFSAEAERINEIIAVFDGRSLGNLKNLDAMVKDSGR